MAPVEFGLLGEVVARADGDQVSIGHARQRCVLAVLAVDAGLLVPSDVLIDRVWGDKPPHRAKAALFSYVSRLRAALPGVVKQRSGGYVLDVDRSTVDLHRFRELAARTADEQSLTEALRLWRGQALAGLSGAWVEQTRDNLEQQRLTTAADLVDVRLRGGEGPRLVDELAERVDAHPLDERVAAQYMLALHRSGRTADALDHHRRLREVLVEELGADPNHQVQDLHQRILQSDPALLTTTAVPRQLPAPPAAFVGRHDQLAALGERTQVTVIAGVGGTGKTWLALRWAHEHQQDFPDGQLHVDLRGFSPEGTPMPAAVAVRGFLNALGVTPDRLPVDPHAQAALLRSKLADQRMLLVLDNAADSGQVTPLLPGGTSCTVLITSRRHLPGLATAHGARHIALGPLPEPEARELLTARLPDAEPAEIDEVIGLCGGFPLALGIIAGRPHLPLKVIIGELRSLGIDALDSDEPSASLPAVLSWSHQALTDEQSRAFELLASAPGPDIALPAAAHLLDRSPGRTNALLGALERMSLVARDSHGRYLMHDLVRQYGLDRARVATDEDRAAALDRVVQAYIGLARYHDSLLDPHRKAPVEITPITAPTADAAGALAWFDAEHACLLACVRQARRSNQVWQLAWVLGSYHWKRGHLHDDLAAWQAGLEAVRQIDEKSLLAMAHQLVGNALARTSRFDEGLTHLGHALRFAEGDERRESHVHLATSLWLTTTGRHAEALPHAKQALAGYRALGMRPNEAITLNGVGAILAELGEYEEAIAYCEAGLELQGELGMPGTKASTLHTLGLVARLSGDAESALRYHESALAIHREIDETYMIPHDLRRIGEALLAQGRTDETVRTWREALAMFVARGHEEDAEATRARLRSVRPDTTP